MRFRLTTIAYVFALLAAAMATFGAWGIVAATLVLTFWVIVYRTPATPLTFWLSLAAISLFAWAFLLPAGSRSQGARSRNLCLLNLKQLYLALENYHHKNGAYPPAYIVDDQGKPMHSWRVLLLPFLEEGDLYREYDFDEPWDGPNNRKLWDRMPAVYGCVGRKWLQDDVGRQIDSMPSNAASYVAVVDDSTAWPGARPLKASEITDRSDDTVLLIEYSGMTAPWTAPFDLTLDQAIELFETSEPAGHVHVQDGFFSAETHHSLYNVAFADGHTDVIPSAIRRDIASAWLTISGREDFSDDKLDLLHESEPRPVSYVYYERVYAFSGFVVLALLPGLRLLFRRRTTAAAPATC